MTKDNVQEPVCHICKGTGEMDHGGTYPWGEAINIPCECTAPPAAQRQWVGLTDSKGVLDFGDQHGTPEFARGALWAEAKLREKNAAKPAVPLTDAQMVRLWINAKGDEFGGIERYTRAVEAELGIEKGQP
jgi:hypothetical protein